ncbi:MAG: hypothetical protein AB1640_11585 [bacterium]
MESAANRMSTDTRPEARAADMAALIGRVRDFLAERAPRTRSWAPPLDPGALSGRFGFTRRGEGKAEVILSDEVAVELGHPSTSSRAMALLSWQPGLVRPGCVSLLGPDLEAMEPGVSHPFAQVVLLEVKEGRMPDPFAIDSAQYLLHRLPGYMVRSVPGRLWVRVSRAGRAAGLDLQVVGSALIAAFTGDFDEVEAAEVVFVTSSRADVEALRQVAAEADILAGRHKKLVLGVDGTVECRELACDTCDEKPVCDNLRDIVIQRRNRKT